MGAKLAVAFILVGSMLLAGAVEGALAAEPANLKVVAKAAKNAANPGSVQKISIKVIDDSGRPVKDASVSATVINPGERAAKQFTGKTDSNGAWSLIYHVEKKGKAGLSGVEVKATKLGYDNGYTSAFYKIVKKS